MFAKTVMVAWTILAVLLLEFFFPKEKISFYKKRKRILKNIFFWLINIGITPILILPITLYATSLQFHSLFIIENKILEFLFQLIIMDAFLYFWHRANHEIPFLWKFHHVHHLDETLDISTGVRFHFGEVILSATLRCFIILAFNINLVNLLIIEGIILMSSMFHHSNIALPKSLESFLSYIIVTPSIHWVHHHKKRKDTDSNYATIFSFWDHLFNSRSFFKRKLKMKIGVEGDKEQSLMQLILRPLYK
jgi:sterol desaturase/sphingolipid hydroxylase (fatty acid hydroxylase superfamily)